MSWFFRGLYEQLDVLLEEPLGLGVLLGLCFIFVLHPEACLQAFLQVAQVPWLLFFLLVHDVRDLPFLEELCSVCLRLLRLLLLPDPFHYALPHFYA